MSDEVDRRLSETGAAWRSAQPAPPEPDPERFTARTAPRWTPYAVAAGVLVLTAGLAAVVLVNQDGGGGGTPPAKGIDADVVRDGDRVTATGTLLQAPGQPLKLCQTNPMIEIYPAPAPSCSPWAVEVPEDAVPRSVQWTETDGVRHTDRLYTVRGVWHGGAIAEASLAPADQPGAEDREFPAPCPAPAGGWAATESAVDRSAVQREVDSHPDRYSGMWVAYQAGAEITVVGTVADPAQVQRALRKSFKQNLCVTRVDYAAAQLTPVAERLKTDDGAWQATIWPERARVAVELFVLDQAARDRIGDDADKVIVRPFVRKI